MVLWRLSIFVSENGYFWAFLGPKSGFLHPRVPQFDKCGKMMFRNNGNN